MKLWNPVRKLNAWTNIQLYPCILTPQYLKMHRVGEVIIPDKITTFSAQWCLTWPQQTHNCFMTYELAGALYLSLNCFRCFHKKKWVPVRIQRINWWMVLTQPPHFYPLWLQKAIQALIENITRQKVTQVLSKSQKWLLREIALREQKILGMEWDMGIWHISPTKAYHVTVL